MFVGFHVGCLSDEFGTGILTFFYFENILKEIYKTSNHTKI